MTDNITPFLIGLILGVLLMGILAATTPRWHTYGEIKFCREHADWCSVADPRLLKSIDPTPTDR